MLINEVKKALYKEKPLAFLKEKKNNGDLIYTATLNDNYGINFFIPESETVDADGKYLFSETMDAKLLIRWIKI